MHAAPPTPDPRPAGNRLGRVRMVTLLCLAGVLAVAVGPRWRDHVLLPGPLSSHHAVFEQDCRRCHSAAESDPIAWVVAPITGNDPYLAPLDSARCQVCHERGVEPLAPHGLSAEALAPLTAEARTRARAAAGAANVALELGAAAWSEHPMACGGCHFEHQGRAHDLTAIASHRCQVCHADRFAGFANGHPEFKSYPYSRPTRIAFDHDSHFRRHFQKDLEHAPTSCIDCHELDGRGETMLTAGFDRACASCHGAQVAGSERTGEVGVAFASMPGIDTEALLEAGLAIDEWPEDADGVATPFMRFLLSADDGAGEWLPVLDQLDPYDLSGATRPQLEATSAFARAARRLFEDLATRGQPALAERLERILNRPLDTTELAELSAQFEPTLWQSFLGDADGAAAGGDEAVIAGGWYRSGFTVYYRPTGHASPFLRRWLDLTTGVPAATPIFSALWPPEDSTTPAPGLCSKCHTLDETPGLPPRIEWRAARPVPDLKRFTEFRHRPHMPLVLSDGGCATCHQLESTAGPGAFTPIPKSTCVRCHDETHPESAGTSCQLCHRYHVGSYPPRVPWTPLTGARPPR